MKKIIFVNLLIITSLQLSCNKNNNITGNNHQEFENISQLSSINLQPFNGVYIKRIYPNTLTTGTYGNFSTDFSCEYTLTDSMQLTYHTEIKLSETYLDGINIHSFTNNNITIIYNNDTLSISTNYSEQLNELTMTYLSKSITLSNLTVNQYSDLNLHLNNSNNNQAVGWPVVFGAALLIAKAVDEYCDYQQWTQANALTLQGCKTVLYTWCGATCHKW